MSYDTYYQEASSMADNILNSIGPNPAATAGESGRRRGIAARTAEDTTARLKAASDSGLQVVDNSYTNSSTARDFATGYITSIRSSDLFKDTPPDSINTTESLGDTVSIEPGRWLEGGKTNTKALIQSIKDIESSGGDYSARGPVIKSGKYKDQRAMGAYQVMPGNLEEWSKDAFGKVVTEEQFMNSPEMQDALFLHRMEKAKQKYGTIEDAVSVWFTGQPVAKSGEKSDGYMTGSEYLTKFQNGYTRYSNSEI